MAKLPNIVHRPKEFTEEELKVLGEAFTDPLGDVFAIKNSVDQTDGGAVGCRYSRSDKGVPRLWIDEFVPNPDRGLEFYDKVLAQYGDDSVAEMGSGRLCIEGISNVSTRILENPRISIQFIEKSSRYVPIKKFNGQWPFYQDPKIMGSEFANDFVDLIDLLFTSYQRFLEEGKKFYRERFPQEEGVTDRAYEKSIEAKSLDVIARRLLPTAWLTDVAAYGNFRAWETAILGWQSHPMQEPRDIANAAYEELNQVAPAFFRKIVDEKGEAHRKYLRETREGMQLLANSLSSDLKPESPGIKLVSYDSEAEAKVAAALLFEYSNGLSLEQLQSKVKSLPSEERKKILSEAMQRRENRRHKPPRAFENAVYTFEFLDNIGVYREIRRHRMNTQEAQNYTTRLGYDIHQDVVEAGLEGELKGIMEKVDEVHTEIRSKYPLEAQYAATLGNLHRWYMTMNAREFYFLTELRSTPEAHPDARRIAQSMYRLVENVHPWVTEQSKFINLSGEEHLERLRSEVRIDKKLGNS